MCTNSLSSWTQRWYLPSPGSQDFATPGEQARCCSCSLQGGKQGKAHWVGSPGVEPSPGLRGAGGVGMGGRQCGAPAG